LVWFGLVWFGLVSFRLSTESAGLKRDVALRWALTSDASLLERLRLAARRLLYQYGPFAYAILFPTLPTTQSTPRAGRENCRPVVSHGQTYKILSAAFCVPLVQLNL
jgi:hypothetical protein